MNKEQYEKLQELIDKSSKIVFFGGAGVSTESGIPDFRSTDGLYNMEYKYPPEKIISHSFFISNPEEFYKFYKSKMVFPLAKPNKAHLKLFELEDKNKLLGIITQNIDGLHTDSKNKKVYELHGSVRRNHCMKCHKFYDQDYILNSIGVPRCTCGGIIKPDVVLYEEQLDDKVLADSIKIIKEADLLIVGGTSLMVYPAAGLIRYFNKGNMVLINKDKTPYDYLADLIIHENIKDVLDRVVVK